MHHVAAGVVPLLTARCLSGIPSPSTLIRNEMRAAVTTRLGPTYTTSRSLSCPWVTSKHSCSVSPFCWHITLHRLSKLLPSACASGLYRGLVQYQVPICTRHPRRAVGPSSTPSETCLPGTDCTQTAGPLQVPVKSPAKGFVRL
ncbi:hypothetical protein C7974DRAFT_186599 [Boeremia exigua]|uniref:uncharacterized protein n=1 Tax=Boeremia exigua TaxID=749465 RepID=UPI001E8EA6E7|nr:uncharacterized protein C7974DRAFT_186599 [Boeremia exigua]KAH6629455.1 hypothetical protein C7974DRAFT_186599 [Boeremia exigua]